MNENTGKKRKPVTLLLLLLVLVVLVLVLVGLRAYNRHIEEKAAQDAAGITMLTVDVDQVQSFSYPYDGSTLTFIQQDGEWTCAEAPSVDLDDDMVKSMLNAATDLTTDTIVTNDLSEAADYGLDNPSFTLAIQKTNGTSSVLQVGDENPMVAVCYAYVEGDDRIFAMDTTFVSSFVGLEDLVETEDADEEANDEAEDTGADADDDTVVTDDDADGESDGTGELTDTVDTGSDGETGDESPED